MFSRSTKLRFLLLVVCLLILPLLLAACGGGGPKADSAENFLKAMTDGDASKAKEYVCDDLHEMVDVIALVAEGEGGFDDIDCKEDGDDVNCSVKVGDEKGDLNFKMDGDDKICGGDLFP